MARSIAFALATTATILLVAHPAGAERPARVAKSPGTPRAKVFRASTRPVRADNLQRASGKLQARLREGHHKLPVSRSESAELRVEKGTTARVDYELGDKGQVKSLDVRLNKPLELRNVTRAAASAATERQNFLVRTAAHIGTAFVNPWVRLSRFQLTADAAGGVRLTPHLQGDVGMLRIPVKASLPIDANAFSIPIPNARELLPKLVEDVAANFAVTVAGKSGKSQAYSGTLNAAPTDRGVELKEGTRLRIDGSEVRGDLEIKGQLEID